MTHTMSTLRFVHRSRAHHCVTDGPVWVPCEFDVDADGHAEIVGGSRCHKYPALAKQASAFHNGDHGWEVGSNGSGSNKNSWRFQLQICVSLEIKFQRSFLQPRF